jgi:hypothetical protein
MSPTLGLYPILSIRVFFWRIFANIRPEKYEFDQYKGFFMGKMVLLLGLLCWYPDPNARPTMGYVHQVLTGNIKLPPIPFHKPIGSSSTQKEIEFVDMITSSTSNDGESSIDSSSSIHSKLDRSW